MYTYIHSLVNVYIYTLNFSCLGIYFSGLVSFGVEILIPLEYALKACEILIPREYALKACEAALRNDTKLMEQTRLTIMLIKIQLA